MHWYMPPTSPPTHTSSSLNCKKMRCVSVKREDLKACSLPERRQDHPLLSIGSICLPHLHLGTVCFSHPISQTLQGRPEGGQTTPARENVGGGHRQPNCPDLSTLGVVPRPAPAGHGSPDGGKADRTVHPSPSPSRATAAGGACCPQPWWGP